MSCIFCRIVAGDIPCHRVHEDEHVLAFLDIGPLAAGHTLVVPRLHHALYEELSPATLTAMAMATAVLSRALRRVTGATATTLAINNGAAAGQEVPHCHLHIVPRSTGDAGGPIHALFTHRPEAGDLGGLADKVRDEVARA